LPRKTDYWVEATGCTVPQLYITEYEAEDSACANVGKSSLQLLSAWTDGTGWLDVNGTIVGWADWPPEDWLLGNDGPATVIPTPPPPAFLLLSSPDELETRAMLFYVDGAATGPMLL
jgi:hypothetical protein